MRRLATVSGISLTLVLAALVAAGAAAPPPPGVTTTIMYVDPAAPQFQANSGQLNATFRATAGPGGTWSVAASFKPHDLDHGVFVIGPVLPWVWTEVRQTASATVSATTGQPASFTAPGLRGADGSNLVVACTLTVGAGGVVTVQSLVLGSWVTGGEQ